MASKHFSALDFSDREPEQAFDDMNSQYLGENQPSHLRRNKTERWRLQGLQQTLATKSMIDVQVQPKTLREKWNIWMINEGGKQLFFAVWIFLHLLVAAFGALNYQLSDNLANARATFGLGYSTSFKPCLFCFFHPGSILAFARSAALVLYVDVIFILLPVCRNFISLLRQTPLNDIIPFDKSVTFHKATGWSIVVWTIVHISSHMFNFVMLAKADPDAKTFGARIIVFLSANFATGPGVTGWIMTACLAIMVWFATEGRRGAHFERFWYSHHLFIPFFVCWQLHGMFCMIKPDRPPYCSWNNIGLFWVRFYNVTVHRSLMHAIFSVIGW
jgi:hypothetical protein